MQRDLKNQQQLKERPKSIRRFQQVKCNATNCIFIKTTIDDPVKLSLAIMDDLIEKKCQKTKRLIRLLPVQRTCKAHIEDITKTTKEMADEYFKNESKSFCVAAKIRNNSSIQKSIVKDLANIIMDANSNNEADFKTPDVVFNVDVIKNVCCLSYLPAYLTTYKKYNLLELSSKDENNSESLGAKDEEGIVTSSPSKKDDDPT